MSQETSPSGANSGALAEPSVAFAPRSEKSARDTSASPSLLSAATSASVGPPVPSQSFTAARAGPDASASWAPKLRSCVVCRSRKVRCDKQSPCSNCRRAGIACVVPSGDRPPKWARRLERVTNNAALAAGSTVVPAPGRPSEGEIMHQQQQQQQQQQQEPPPPPPPPSQQQSQLADTKATTQVLDRLRNLEDLVKSLSGQLEQANATISRSHGNSPSEASSTQGMSTAVAAASAAKTSSNPVGLQKQFGRLVLQDAGRSVFVSSAYWSRISDEIEGLKRDTRGLATGDSDSSDDEDISDKSPPSTYESDRAPSERHGFLFRHNLEGPASNLQDFRPLPSQVSFLLDVFSENVNVIFQATHMPTVHKTLRGKWPTNVSQLSPENEALMFSIYYAAVTSMEDEDVMANFGTSKNALNLKFRHGLELALAKADFLNAPTLTLVQAFVNFLMLLRRHDSPKFVWMMTGLAIRMAQAIGLQRDGSHFPNLSPYEVEMRRRVWWALIMVDIRASEDQGSEYTIGSESFDTKLPLNINDEDISPDTTETPVGREALTDMSMPLVSFEMATVIRKIFAPRPQGDAPSLEEQDAYLRKLFSKFEKNYLQYSDEGTIAYWVGMITTRLVISKLTLFVYLPALFATTSDGFSEEIRNKLLVNALEVAEYNHSLNAEPEARRWRWVYQVYTHWNVIIYLLIEVARRPWSPLVERCWIALHSNWLIPARASENKNLHVWIPLRKLMTKARKHRDAEIQRLRGSDEHTIDELEQSDRNVPTPASSGPVKSGEGEEVFRKHWRRLFASSPWPENQGQAMLGVDSYYPPTGSVSGTSTGPAPPSAPTGNVYGPYETWSMAGSAPVTNPSPSSFAPVPAGWQQSGGLPAQGGEARQWNAANPATPSIPVDWSTGQATNVCPSFSPWAWAEGEPQLHSNFRDNVASGGVESQQMDLDADVDWNTWLESAASMEASWGM